MLVSFRIHNIPLSQNRQEMSHAGPPVRRRRHLCASNVPDMWGQVYKITLLGMAEVGKTAFATQVVQNAPPTVRLHARAPPAVALTELSALNPPFSFTSTPRRSCL